MGVKNSILLGVGLADNVSKQLDTMANKLRGKMRNLASVGSEMTMGLTLPIVAAGGATLKFAADLDALKKALAATMGSASGAEAEFLKLKEAAKAPGIGLDEAIKGSFLLQGLGDSADEARRQMLALAKAVALSGGGEAQFAGVMHQFTQMKGVGKILGGDVRFMIENAQILSKVLNDAFGTASPEKIRDMGISVEEFTDKLITGLEGMKGISGSLKNNLENVWTAIRIGTGEIGLAALGATNWDQAIGTLADTITEITGKIRDWIRANPELTKGILKALAAMAVTGPLVRFIADLGLAASFVAKLGGALTTIPGLLVNIDKAAKTLSLTAFGWVGVAAAAVWGLYEAITALDRAMYKDENGNRIVKTDKNGRKYTQAFAGRGSGPNYIMDPISDEARMSASGLMNKLNVAGSELYKGYQEPQSIIKKKRITPPKDNESKGEKGPFLYEGWDVEGYGDMFSTPGDFNPAEGMGKGKFMAGALPGVPLGIDTDFLDKIRTAKDITREFEQAIIDASIAQNLGATDTETLGMHVDALADKYKNMADVYGEGSLQATTALAEFLSMNDAYLQKLKEIEAQEAKRNAAIATGISLMEGISETFAGAITGAKGFAVALLKAVGAMIKLAVVTYVQKTIEDLGFLGAIPAIIGGGILIGAIEGLISKASLAKGGVLTGETMVRAGEYPGVAANPEVISPVSVIQKYIRQAVSESGGGGGYSVIRGDDILLVTAKAQSRAIRRGSGNIITF